MNIIDLLNIIMIIAVFITVVLSVVLVLVLFKGKQKENKNKTSNTESTSKVKNQQDRANKKSTFDFLEFDSIKDNMIIRKNREQYVMVIECKGINYDLLSEEEKISVESGFTQFLNSLRFPVQLYIQTSCLNLRDIISQYKDRLLNMQKRIQSLESEINKEKMLGNEKRVRELSFNKRREENVIEYTADISEYIERLSQNRNVLQQKPYIAISYYKNEIGRTDNYSNDEIDSIAFSELYTRAQTVISALASSGVLGKVISSEDLIELLYVAYNRDDTQYMSFSQAVAAEYDSLYSTGKDVLKKKEELIEQQIEREALDLATNSITVADEKLKEKERNKSQKVKEQALGIIEEYKDQMKDDLYQQTKKEIMGTEDEIIQEKPKRGRHKKVEE